jgi:hypothetical protein
MMAAAVRRPPLLDGTSFAFGASTVSLALVLIAVPRASWAVVGGDAGTMAAPASPPAAGSAPPRAVDGRELIVPIPGAERLRVDNPLGGIVVRAWDRADAMHIIADKQSSSPEALARLRVHFTAWAGGEISIEARVEAGGRERALPLSASRVDLIIEVPAELGVEAKTFAGDLSVIGLRAGARLETTGGRIVVNDVHGRVITHQLRGGQSVAAVEGDVDLDGVEGHMHLDRLGGTRVEARVVDGDIRADDLRSDDVRLSATTGAVVLFGVLRPHAHYDLRSYGGEVRLAVVGAPAGFELRARSSVPVVSAIPLATLWQKGDRMRAVTASAGARGGMTTTSTAATGTSGRPIVELSSVLGRVVVDSVPLVDRLQ